MPDTPDDARLTLAIASEPGDRITGTLPPERASLGSLTRTNI